MRKSATELVFILDRSGSMSNLEKETIDGYNSLLQRQKKLSDEAIVTTVLFDNEYELLHDRLNIKAIAPITSKDYYVRGYTALLDAIGKTITKIDNVQKSMAPEYRPDKVVVAITTDGMENASREYSLQKVKSMVEHQQEKHGWEFLFLGANMDAISTAGAMGIKASHAANFHADNVGVELQYEYFEDILCLFNKKEPLKDNWQNDMEMAYQERIKESGQQAD